MMQRTQLVLFVFLAAAIMASGCGTVCNLASGDPKLYGGCEQDPLLSPPTHPIKLDPSHVPEKGSGSGACGLLLVLLLYPTEACLDLAGDTLTWPIVYLLRTPDDPPDSKSSPRTTASYPDPAEFIGAGAVVHSAAERARPHQDAPAIMPDP
jgi:hypothetical protein